MEQEKQGGSTVLKGITWSAIASTLWAVSGALMQIVAKNEAVPAIWFLSVRTFFAGVILLVIGAFQVKSHIFDVFKSKRSIMLLLIYSILGLAMNMSTFYMSIQTGNAAAATLLQYLAPLFIVIYGILFLHRKPLRDDVLVFVIALIGIILSVTKGNLGELSIPFQSIVWGLLSAVSAGIYYSVPKPLMEKNSPFVVLGWGTLIASVLFNAYQPIWVGAPHINTTIILGIGGVIMIGTVGAFSSMLYSLRFASSEVLSIVDAVEPVMTFIISVIFLGLALNWVEALGATIVIFSIYLLQRSHRKKTILDSK